MIGFGGNTVTSPSLSIGKEELLSNMFWIHFYLLSFVVVVIIIIIILIITIITLFLSFFSHLDNIHIYSTVYFKLTT